MKKRLWQIHSWLGLLCGAGLLVIGLSGSVLVFQDELDAWRRPSGYHATPTPAGRLPFDNLWTAAQRALPGWTIADWTPAPYPGLMDRLRGRPPGETKGILKINLNPYTGEVHGVPATYEHTLSGFLLILHTSFFAGTTGTLVVGLLAVTLLLLGVSGGWLYRGFWRNFLTLRWRASARLFFSDLHKMVGISSVAFNLILGFTGAWWNLQGAYGKLFNSAKETHGDKVEEKSPSPAPQPFDLVGEHLSIDGLIARANQQLPGFRPTSFAFPSKREGDFTFYGAVPTVNPLRSDYGSRVIFHAPDGELRQTIDIRRAGPWEQVYDTFAPLHFGTFGGLPIKILWCLGGFTPGTLAVSGFLLWRARQGRRRNSPTPPGSTTSPGENRPSRSPTTADSV